MGHPLMTLVSGRLLLCRARFLSRQFSAFCAVELEAHQLDQGLQLMQGTDVDLFIRHKQGL